APVSTSSPKRDSVPKSYQERVSVPKGSIESPEAHKCPPSRQLLPPPLLSSGSPCAHLQPTICAVSWLEDPLSLPPSSESRNPPQPVDPNPLTIAPSSPPWPGSPLVPPGSLVPPALPWFDVDHSAPRDSAPLAAPYSSVPLAPSGPVRLLHPFGSSLVLCRSVSTTACWIHASVAGAISSTSALRILLVTLAHRLSVYTSGLLCHLLRRYWSTTWSHQPFLLHGSSLRQFHCGVSSWPWPGSHPLFLRREDTPSGRWVICQEYGPVLCFAPVSVPACP
ncbi:hypothetical protein M9458_015627, partial [Cirrhinus mrigala]